MELGVHLGWSVMRWPAGIRQDLVQQAERLGYDSIWTGESTGCDAATPLAMVATLTGRARVGAAALQMPGRTPAMTAMTAVTLDRLSEGRFVLGIGASTRPVSEDWHGQPFAHQLARTRDYVATLRQALSGQRVQIDGETLSLPGRGRPMRMTEAPMQDRIPILIGAIGPRNLALCAEIADGWISTMIPPARLAEDLDRVHSAAEAAGRDLSAGFEVVAHVMTSIDDDAAVARDRVRPMLAVYAGMGPSDRNLYRRLYDELGFSDEIDVVTDHFQAGRVEEARAALSDAFIDAVTLCGTPDTVARRVQEYRRAGVTTLMANFQTDDSATWEHNLQALARIALAPPAGAG